MIKYHCLFWPQRFLTKMSSGCQPGVMDSRANSMLFDFTQGTMTSSYRLGQIAKALPLLLFGLVAVAAQPQQEQEAARPAEAPVLPTQLQYESVLAAGAAADPQLQNWAAANDRVNQIGGWRAYAREVMTGVPADQALGGDAAQPKSVHTDMRTPAHMHMDMKGHNP